MGGKAEAPAPPNYSAVAASDARAAQLQYDLGTRQLEQQERFAAASGARADEFFQMSRDAEAWGRKQFDTVWPYALEYMESQQALSTLAGENASEAVLQSRENRRQAAETYQRYQREFVPLEQEFTQRARDLASPERAAAASGAAQADVATAFEQQQQAREQQLRGYGIDPSEARYQGESALSGISEAASRAAAGTQARRQQEALGLSALQQAAAIGQKLPTTALAQIEAASQVASGGLQGGQYGGQGITGANAVFGTGATAGGSPVGYGYLSNPYTSLSGTSGQVGTSLMGAGNTALGNQAQAMNYGFSNQLQSAQFEQKQDEMLWGGIGKAFGGIGSLALAPVTGGGSLFGNFMGRALR